MTYHLAKTDPATYSIDQFEREKRTVWDGVRNPQALRAIRAMQRSDRVFLYHSGGESRVVGLAEVIGEPRPDPSDSKLTVVELRFLFRLDPPTTLADIRGAGRFGDWALLRQSRLSTMPAPQDFVAWMRRRYPQMDI